jgi:hypothetical protein
MITTKKVSGKMWVKMRKRRSKKISMNLKQEKKLKSRQLLGTLAD